MAGRLWSRPQDVSEDADELQQLLGWGCLRDGGRGCPGEPSSWWERPFSLRIGHSGPAGAGFVPPRGQPQLLRVFLVLAIYRAAACEVISGAFSAAPGSATPSSGLWAAGKWLWGSLHCGPASAQREAVGSGQAALQAWVAGQSRQEAAPAPHASPAPACVQELQDPWGLFQLLGSFTSSLLSLVQAPGRPPGLPLEQESAQVRGGLREAGSSPQAPSSVLPALSSRRLLPSAQASAAAQPLLHLGCLGGFLVWCLDPTALGHTAAGLGGVCCGPSTVSMA